MRLYKRMLGMFLLLLSTQSLSAQCEGWRMGLEVGPNFFRMPQGAFAHEYENEFGFGLQLSGEKQIGERAHLGFGLGWTRLQFAANYKWDTSEPNDPALPDNGTFRLDYLDIPLRFSYDVIQKERWSAFLYAGGSASLLLRSQYEVITQGGGTTTPPEPISKGLLGFEAGLGLAFQISPRIDLQLSSGVRYLHAGTEVNRPGRQWLLDGRLGIRYHFGK